MACLKLKEARKSIEGFKTEANSALLLLSRTITLVVKVAKIYPAEGALCEIYDDEDIIIKLSVCICSNYRWVGHVIGRTMVLSLKMANRRSYGS